MQLGAAAAASSPSLVDGQTTFTVPLHPPFVPFQRSSPLPEVSTLTVLPTRHCWERRKRGEREEAQAIKAESFPYFVVGLRLHRPELAQSLWGRHFQFLKRGALCDYSSAPSRGLCGGSRRAEGESESEEEGEKKSQRAIELCERRTGEKKQKTRSRFSVSLPPFFQGTTDLPPRTLLLCCRRRSISSPFKIKIVVSCTDDLDFLIIQSFL